MKAKKLKVIKTAARRFRDRGDLTAELIAPAEYEIRQGIELVALIIKAQDGWRACRPTENSRIGLAISPVDLNAFRQVRA